MIPYSFYNYPTTLAYVFAKIRLYPKYNIYFSVHYTDAGTTPITKIPTTYVIALLIICLYPIIAYIVNKINICKIEDFIVACRINIL